MIPAIGFELHRNGRVDFALAVTDARDLARLAVGHRGPACERLARVWPPFVHTVWLEMDSDRSCAEPSLFFPPDAHGHEAAYEADQWHPAWLDLAAVLRDEPLSPVTRAILARACAALPAPARLSQVGLMPGRGSKAIRVCLTNFSAGEVAPFLDEISWSGTRERLRPLLAIAGTYQSLLTLQLDVEEALSPRIGIEIAPRFPGDLSQWQVHLDALFAEGLVDAGILRVLTQWRDPKQLRRISHVKVIYDGDSVESKAYVGQQVAW